MKFTVETTVAEVIKALGVPATQLRYGDLVMTGHETLVLSWEQNIKEGEGVLATNYGVQLMSPGPNKINVIKIIREMTGLGLREAKDLAETTGGIIFRNVARLRAVDAAERLCGVGAQAYVIKS